MIEVKNLTKRYGDKYALNNISFEVNQGEILGFLGPNGAGKTTTMNILTGYLSTTDGNAVVAGHDILENPIEAKKCIGYLPEQPPLYPDMTVKEYLNFMYELKRVKLPRKKHIEEILETVKLTDVYGRLIKNLSKGYRQRVGLAQALLGAPEVLILDEPTVGLDPQQIIEIRNLIQGLGKQHTVILSSHILSEIQAVCDRVVVINKGNIVADDTPDNLAKTLSNDYKLTVRIEGAESEVKKLLGNLSNMKSVETVGEKEPGVFEYIIETSNNTDVRRELFTKLSEKAMPLLELRRFDLTLEDIFLEIIGNKQDDNENEGGEN